MSEEKIGVFAIFKEESGGGWSYRVSSLAEAFRTKGQFDDIKAAERHFKRECRKNGWHIVDV